MSQNVVVYQSNSSIQSSSAPNGSIGFSPSEGRICFKSMDGGATFDVYSQTQQQPIVGELEIAGDDYTFNGLFSPSIHGQFTWVGNIVSVRLDLGYINFTKLTDPLVVANVQIMKINPPNFLIVELPPVMSLSYCSGGLNITMSAGSSSIGIWLDDRGIPTYQGSHYNAGSFYFTYITDKCSYAYQ